MEFYKLSYGKYFSDQEWFTMSLLDSLFYKTLLVTKATFRIIVRNIENMHESQRNNSDAHMAMRTLAWSRSHKSAQYWCINGVSRNNNMKRNIEVVLEYILIQTFDSIRRNWGKIQWQI